MTDNAANITETSIFSGFNIVTRNLLSAWKKFIIQFDDPDSKEITIKDMNQHLRTNNVVVFFDHHYAFDPIPMILILTEYTQFLESVLVPYAVHLDMGVGREGEFSIRYKIRTAVFNWFIRNIQKNNPTIKVLPVVREFEMDNPRLREIVENEYTDINTQYIRTLVKILSQNKAGQACVLSPFSGIGFPGKPALHPQLHRSIKIAHTRAENELIYYLIGAYPGWQAQRSYYAPILSKHTIVIRGPIPLPIKNYEESKAMMASEISKLRQQANFTTPDYDRILTK